MLLSEKEYLDLTHVLFVGPLIPLFWTSGDICPGFQSQGGLICMLSCLRAIPQIHIWCDTCWPLDGQHGSQATLTHILAAVRRIHKHWWHWGWNRGSNHGLGLLYQTLCWFIYADMSIGTVFSMMSWVKCCPISTKKCHFSLKKTYF